MLTANELDEFLTQEDAPQVVGMIDDRPMALRLDDYRKSSKWKLVGSDDETESKSKIYDSYTDRGPPEKFKLKDSYSQKRNKHSDSDASPPRKSNVEKKYLYRSHEFDKNVSHRNRDRCTSSDTSPPRRKRSPDSDASPPRQNRKRTPDSDESPIRKKSYFESNSILSRKSQRNPNSDVSPPRRHKKDSDSDTSPPRKRKSIDTNLSYRSRNRNADNDGSPPRRHRSPGSDQIPYRKNKNSDLSPVRKKYKDVSPSRKKYIDNSPTRRKVETNKPRKSRWGDSSPPRYRRTSNSPKRNMDFESKHRSPERNKYRDYDRNRDRKSGNSNKNYDKIKERDSEPSTSKMEKTLDGKTAGLQNARDLKQETIAFKQREDELFKKMSEDVSGQNAAPIIRDRKTGKKRDFEKEAMEEFAKIKKQQEQKEKYDKWGKGLKQVDDLKEKIEADLHEMNKPLARYADDEDLEKYLKEQEREGDPMLAYIRKKKKKEAVNEGRPQKPVYEGEFMPNRFGVPPGHRWDGVDRSNGYEKQWFAKENAKKAVEEEIYKWSTEDM